MPTPARKAIRLPLAAADNEQRQQPSAHADGKLRTRTTR